jgi:catechol 2,3-dioxygenase-like lactoylglutathione lyase family enzyme
MAVHDVIAATDFYGKKLGLLYVENEAHGLWRYFETQRTTFELFHAHPDRIHVNSWGNGQAFRPVILVDDLSSTAALLQDKGITYSRSTSEFGAQIEMVGPEEFRWGLEASPAIEVDWAHPIVGGIELKVSDLMAQKSFYTEVFGLSIRSETNHAVHLKQSNGETWLRIVAGGTPTTPPFAFGEEKPAFFYPIWISLETKDIKRANTWLQELNVTILHPLTYHEDWLGTDIILADLDGNPIQVVQYGRMNDNKEKI